MTPSQRPLRRCMASEKRAALDGKYTWRLLCSFLVVTCLLFRSSDIPPKKELRRSLQVHGKHRLPAVLTVGHYDHALLYVCCARFVGSAF